VIRTADIHWSAGFIDGEGSFCKHGHTIGVSAVQKDEWHVRKLESIFGGSVALYRRNNGESYWRWTLYGSSAAGIMMTLYSLMSPRRREKIEELLKWWKAKGLRGSFNRQKTHCPKGHEYSGENLILKKNGGRDCRACQNLSSREYKRRQRAALI